jgi:hypothetical protein
VSVVGHLTLRTAPVSLLQAGHILADLAGRDPIRHVSLHPHQSSCRFCFAVGRHPVHRESCIWRRAVLWLPESAIVSGQAAEERKRMTPPFPKVER